MITSTRKMLERAQNENYSVPAFSVHNMEILQVVIDTAYKMRSPVIISCTPSIINNYKGIEYIKKILDISADKYDIPIAVYLNHFGDVEAIKKDIDMGFKSCKVDERNLNLEENIKVVSEVVKYAHRYDAVVEAALGVSGERENNANTSEKDCMYTNPEDAEEFVKRTGVDSLAVAIGTEHGLYKVEVNLDFNRLMEIKERVKVPLVLYGASDVPDELIKIAISLGICKSDFDTDLKIPFSNSIKEYFKQNSNSDVNYMIPGKETIAEIVEHKINVCGSLNKY